MANSDMNAFTYIVTAATTVVRTGAGILHAITCNKAIAAGTITIYDGLTAAGTKIGIVTHPATLLQNHYTLIYDVAFTTGLTIVTAEANDITVSWRPL